MISHRPQRFPSASWLMLATLILGLQGCTGFGPLSQEAYLIDMQVEQNARLAEEEAKNRAQASRE
ncbi:MAG: hypothetical protein HQL95_15800, partial [Magnetococcales bacterium]|nr:hypothetical protein [Magnetococcales bacterium]